MALTGHLSDLSLSELIEFFCNQRKTGQLKVLYPQGHGSFYLQSGSVVDARIGVLRGIDAVYYALTLPNAKFEFSGESELTERTINQPWTQVVLEGLRRLDEGIIPTDAFPADYEKEKDELAEESSSQQTTEKDFDQTRVPAFLSFINKESMGKRKFVMAGAAAVAVIASLAAIGIPAGWYGPAKSPAVVSQPPSAPETTVAAADSELPATENSAATAEPELVDSGNDAAELAARRQREKEKARAREEKAAPLTPPTASASTAPAPAASDSAKPGPKKITVTVTYDESGRVTQASGGDAGAIRIARQKRFPAGKAGSATITIPVN
ncbi:MAG TPA: DUF4388 domain-containing protein [Pyrinomonadaceae bacterium]|nr:DUF4388 domain-containing protein [Pyrinomonadaceae bacterium]